MSELFRRAGQVQLGTLLLVIDPELPGGSLDVAFDVFATTAKEPNTADVKIWNLTPENRFILEEQGDIPIAIEAGYADKVSQIYLGEIRNAWTERDGADLVTTLQSGDGEKKTQQSRINISIAKGATNQQVIDALLKALDVGRGNVDTWAASIAAVRPLFPNGTTLTGSAAQVLGRITQSLGLEYSIQSGALQILPVNEPLAGTATEISADSGMIGSPSLDNDGRLTVATLMLPDVFPGRLVVVESEFISGNFRVESCRYSGGTADNDWGILIEATKI